MKKKIQLEKSGISLVDNAWGGFYRGGSYLVIGPHKSGRTLLGLQFAMECARQKEICLYFTVSRPKDLMINAASIDFDLQHYMNQNLIIVVRVAPPTDLSEVDNPDNFLVDYLRDIVTVVQQYQPSKIVFDELTPFIGFSNLNLLQDVFAETCETIEDSGITSLFVLGEPATPAAKLVLDTITTGTTGAIYLQKKKEAAGRGHSGRITISPNIGHTEGEFSSSYTIEPYKGITLESQDTPSTPATSGYQDSSTPPEESKYTSLSEIELPEESYTFSNFYSINDFNLILNNQIALFKSTGQIFTIVSFKLDPAAEARGLLTISQLQNAIRLSTDKKDKICVINNKVVVLVTKEDRKSINSLIAKIKSNLPGGDPEFLKRITPYISVYAIKVDENVNSADDIFHELMSDEHQRSENKLGFH